MRQLMSSIKEEWIHAGRDWTMPGFRAMVVYRFGVWVERRARGRRLLRRIHRSLYRYVRNHYGIELRPSTTVGARCLIGHQHGIVIHPLTVIGDDCVILQNVTIGAPARDRIEDAPTLGDRVRVGAGVVIVGRVHIGDGARIGPNAVVTANVPAGATVFGNPARVIPAAAERSQ